MPSLDARIFTRTKKYGGVDIEWTVIRIDDDEGGATEWEVPPNALSHIYEAIERHWSLNKEKS